MPRASVKRGSLTVEGLVDVQKAYRRLPKDVKEGTDGQVRAVAKFVAKEAKSAASTRAERKAATTIKAQKNSVSLGGGGKRSRAGSMSLGTEFGGRGRPRTMQFRNHRGTEGYFFWPSIRSNSEKIKKMWDDMMEDILRGLGGE